MSIVIIGVGNRLMGDDGFGSCLAEAIRKKVRNADVIDLGLGNLLSVNLEKYHIIILIDVADVSECGIYKVSQFSEKDLSLHSLGLQTVMEIYPDKKFFVVACRPNSIELGQGLSQDLVVEVGHFIPKLAQFLKSFNVEINTEEVIKYIREECSYNLI